LNDIARRQNRISIRWSVLLMSAMNVIVVLLIMQDVTAVIIRTCVGNAVVLLSGCFYNLILHKEIF